MAISDRLKKYREENIRRIPLDVPAPLYEKFKAAVERRGDKVNTVLRKAIEDYIDSSVVVDQHIEAVSDLAALMETIQKEQTLPGNYMPQQWEKAVPKKYWGRFGSYSEFSKYISANHLSDQLEAELEAMLEDIEG